MVYDGAIVLTFLKDLAKSLFGQLFTLCGVGCGTKCSQVMSRAVEQENTSYGRHARDEFRNSLFFF